MRIACLIDFLAGTGIVVPHLLTIIYWLNLMLHFSSLNHSIMISMKTCKCEQYCVSVLSDQCRSRSRSAWSTMHRLCRCMDAYHLETVLMTQYSYHQQSDSHIIRRNTNLKLTHTLLAAKPLKTYCTRTFPPARKQSCTWMWFKTRSLRQHHVWRCWLDVDHNERIAIVSY